MSRLGPLAHHVERLLRGTGIAAADVLVVARATTAHPHPAGRALADGWRAATAHDATASQHTKEHQ